MTGVIESPVFELTGARIAFLVGGGAHRNTYVALWKGPTEKQLAELKKAGMRAICHQNKAGLETDMPGRACF